MQEKCIHDCHDSRAAGHLGQFKTLEKLRQSVIWSNMTRDSKLHVKTCAVCNKQKKPTKSAKAEVVSKVLVDNVFSRLGCPIELHTDQGKNMDGNLVRQLCGLLQIAKTITTPYHPSSNGQVERYNRTILQTISCFLRSKQQDWDLWL